MSTAEPVAPGTHFESKEAEEKWDRFWEEKAVHRFDESKPGDPFTVDTPPPTVSGSLHVGHVFSYTQTDAIARYQRMRGKNVFYPMGWDDNGLPTERRVQNYFHVRCEPKAASVPGGLKLGPADDAARKAPAREVSRKDFIDLCLELTQEDERAFKALWRRLALSVDWNLEYSTIDAHSRRIAQASFLDLHRKGHVYSLEAPTMWDVDFRTAVAQAEVEDRSGTGAFHDIRFGVEGQAEGFVIATTRPELLPACVGVAAHPEDERYKGLFGQRAVTPIFRAPVPIFPSALVDPQKGTGILMVCTFGDATDVVWWREEKLALRQILGRDGRLVPVTFGTKEWPSLDAEKANAAYAELASRHVKEARRRVVELLRDPAHAATGSEPALVAEPKPVEHSVKYYEKGDRPLEFITTRQWFVRLMDKKAQLVELGDSITWHPDFMRTRYKNWTENLQFDWCISRQRYFGVSFPVWYPLDANGNPDFDHPVLAEEAALPVDPVSDTPPGYTEAQRDKPGGFTAEPDVFDTWFTSSLTPQIATRWMLAPERHRRLFPMDVRPQSHEIIRTWAFYTIAKAMLHEQTIPWRNVAISGWVLDPDRKKMSKSKGNVLTPMHLLDQYGSDAVRYWSLSARLGVDTAFDEKVIKSGRRLVTKIFNASKFLLAQGGGGGRVERALDRGFLARLQALCAEASSDLDAYEYAAALDRIERFFWRSFTDTYLELVKNRAKSETDAAGKDSALAALRQGLGTLLRLFAPFLPYVTEEAWSWQFAEALDLPSIHKAPWPAATEFGAAGIAGGDAAVFDTAVAFLEAVHRAKSGAGATVGRHVAMLRFAAHPRTAELFARAQDDALAAARVQAHVVEPRDTLEEGSFEVLAIELAAPPAPAAP